MLQHAATQPARTGRRYAIATAVGGLSTCAVLAVVDPEESIPVICPLRLATGLWCPGCGSLRALHALVRGDLSFAFAVNPLLVAAVPVAAYAWASWALPLLGLRGPPRLAAPLGVWWAALAVAVVFTVVRNLGLLPFFAGP